MAHRRQKKSSFFQIRTPFENKKTNRSQGRVSVKITKTVNSWLNATGPNIDTEKLTSIIPAMFKNSQNSSSKSMEGRKLRKTKRNSKRILIDLNKLDQLTNMNPSEKESLRQVLDSLKCDSRENGNSQSNSKESCTKRIKTPDSKRETQTFVKNKKDKKILVNLKNRSTLNKLDKNYSTHSEKINCKECSKVASDSKNRKLKPKTKQKQATTITFSQEQLIQALIETNPGSYGDGFQAKINKSSSNCTITTLFREKPKVEIKNIEVKYINPTYIVQYNNDNTKSGGRVRERLYSTAALDAHLGQIKVPEYKEVKSPEITPMHYAPSGEYLIGVGKNTEEMMKHMVEEHEKASHLDSNQDSASEYLRERAKSSLLVSMESPIPRFSKEITIEELESERVSPVRGKWQKDSIPFYLEQRADSLDLKSSLIKAKKTPKRRKCVDFIKRVFCLSTEETEENLKPKTGKAEIEENSMRGVQMEDFLKAKDPKFLMTDVNIKGTRITKEEFDKGTENQNLAKRKVENYNLIQTQRHVSWSNN